MVYDVNYELFREEENADVENMLSEENSIRIYANRDRVMEPIEEAKEQRRPRRMIIPELDLSQMERFRATYSDIG